MKLNKLYAISLMFVLVLSSACGSGSGSGSGSSKKKRSVSSSSQIELKWDAVTSHEDDTPISGDLAGYKIKYGKKSGEYTTTINVGRNVTNHSFRNLPKGTYYFVVSSFNYSGQESENSIEVKKTIK